MHVGNTLSSMKPLTSGVVQGSCLIGPRLFFIYINDIVSLFDGQCTCKLYADMKLYTIVHTTDFQLHFQQCLDALAKWSDAWQVNISYKKCAVGLMNISHTRNNSVADVSYHIKSNPVLAVKLLRTWVLPLRMT